MKIKIVSLNGSIAYQGEVFNSKDYSELTNRFPKSDGFKYFMKRGN